MSTYTYTGVSSNSTGKLFSTGFVHLYKDDFSNNAALDLKGPGVSMGIDGSFLVNDSYLLNSAGFIRNGLDAFPSKLENFGKLYNEAGALLINSDGDTVGNYQSAMLVNTGAKTVFDNVGNLVNDATFYNTNGADLTNVLQRSLIANSGKFFNDYGATLTNYGILENYSGVLTNSGAGTTIEGASYSSLLNINRTLTDTQAMLMNEGGAKISEGYINNQNSVLTNQDAGTTIVAGKLVNQITHAYFSFPPSSIVNQGGAEIEAANVINASGAQFTNTGTGTLLTDDVAGLGLSATPGGFLNVGTYTSLLNENAAQIVNYGTGFTNEGGATLTNTGIGTTFVNESHATLTNTGAGTRLVNQDGATLTNTGTGTTLLNGSGAYFYNTAGSTLANSSGATFTNSSALQNNGTINNGATFDETATGSMKGTGSFIQSGGATEIDGYFGQNALNVEAGSFTVNHAAVIDGNASDAGSITVTANTTFTVDSIFTVSGSLTVDSGATVDAAVFSQQAGATVLNNGTIDPGAIDVASGSSISGSGTLIGNVVNDGTIIAANGTLEIDGNVTNSGMLEASAGGILVINGTVSGKAVVANGGVIEYVQNGISTLVGATISAGTAVPVGDNAKLALKGTTTNNGAIDLNSTGDSTALYVASNVTLNGAGSIVLSDVAPSSGNTFANAILASSATSKAPFALVNAGNTIEGAGTIGDGDRGLDLVNLAKIEATGANSLSIDTGNVVLNFGLLEGAGAGGLTVDDSVINFGTIKADGGKVALGNGAVISGFGTLLATDSGTLTLGNATILGEVLQTASGGTITTVAHNTATLTDAAIARGSVVSVVDASTLLLQGVVFNSGAIDLASSRDATTLQIGCGEVSLVGGGTVNLSDSAANLIGGTASLSNNANNIACATTSSLFNVDNTITGAGQIGTSALDLINEACGKISSTDADTALNIDAGVLDNYGLIDAAKGELNIASATIANTGMLEADAGGVLDIAKGFVNNGVIDANGGDVMAAGKITGKGSAIISNGGEIEFGAASNQNVTMSGSADTLKLDQAESYTGTIAGLGSSDGIDLADFAYGAKVTLAYHANKTNTGGTLTVTDGKEVANIALLGQFIAADFHASTSSDSGTLVTYNPAHQPNLTAAHT